MIRAERSAPASRLDGILAAVVLAWTAVAFLPCVANEFVDWDDDQNFVQNPHWRGLSGANLAWMLTTRHLGPWQPLSWISLGVDHALFGPGPFGPHLGNVVYHALAALAVFCLARRCLALALPAAERASVSLGAALAALAFALHPLRVESVAWATERRDVLSGLLLAAAFASYLRAASGERLRPGAYCASIALYALSLAAKATGMTLPFVLLACDLWPLRRRALGARRLLLEKLPFALLAAGAAAIAAGGQQEADALLAIDLLGPLDRVRIACFAACFYVGKTLWPGALWAHYALPPELDFSGMRFTLALAAVALTTLVAWIARARWPGLALVWTTYLLLLAPVSGLVLAGRQLAADRYSYLPGIVLGLGLAALAVQAHERLRARAAWLVPGCALLVLAAWTWRTTAQIGTWRDSETLWRHVLHHEPASAPAHNNLANLLEARGDTDEALAHFEAAARLAPADALVHFNLARGYVAAGRIDEALAAAARATELDPAFWQAWLLAGTQASEAGRHEHALDALRSAVRLEPDFLPVRNALVAALARAGRPAEAAAEVEAALGLPGGRAPQLARLHRLCDELARPDLARRVLALALERFPEDAELVELARRAEEGR